VPSRAKKKRTRASGSLSRRSGSASRGQIRTTLRFSATLEVDCSRKREPNERRHYFAWDEAPIWNVQAAVSRPARQNPIQLARQWRADMDAHGESKAALARRLGVTRARVTQVLQVLDLDPLVLTYVERQSDHFISERTLRGLRGLSSEDQRNYLADLAVPAALLGQALINGEAAMNSSGREYPSPLETCDLCCTSAAMYTLGGHFSFLSGTWNLR